MSSKWLSVALVFGPMALAGCQREAAAPSYPVPQDPPLEQTDLYPYFEEPAEEAPPEDDWVDTGDDWSLEPADDDDSEQDPTPEGEPEGTPEAAPR